MLTETWLNPGIYTGELLAENYAVSRHDRDYENSRLSRGGGVLVAIKTDLFSKMSSVDVDRCGGFELLWIKIYFRNLPSLLSGVDYFPPTSPIEYYRG